jgi:hypothetical protein
MSGQIVAVLNSVILIIAGIFRIYWAVGGSWGLKYAVPVDEELADDEELVIDERFGRPGKIVSRIIALLYFATAIVLLARTSVVALPVSEAWLSLYCWGAAAVFLLRVIGNFRSYGLFNRKRSTPFGHWDTRLLTPLYLYLAVSIALVNWLVG